MRLRSLLTIIPRVLRNLAGNLGALARALALVVRVEPGTSTGYLILALVSGLLPVAQIWLAKLVVDGLVAGVGADPDWIIALAGGYALTLVVPAALDPIRLALAAWLEDRIVAEVDHRLMDAGAALPDLYRIEQPIFGDELRTVEEVPFWLPRLLPALQHGLSLTITLGGLLALLGGLHPLLPVAIILAALPHHLAEYRLHGLQYKAMVDRSRAAREMSYCVRLTTEPDAAKEVRVFGLGDFFLRRFRERFEAALIEITRLRLTQLRVAVLFSGLYALVLGGGFWFVARQAGQGRLSLGDLALYLNAVIQAQGLSMWLRASCSILYETALRVQGFFRFLDGVRPAIRLPAPGKGHPMPATLRQGIELQGVAFQYAESHRPVLKDVSFRLPAGQVTALVGANGAGKSTLVKLLTRMYDPIDGTILLDGTPLYAYDLDSLRARIAVVYQDFARFSLTFRENIALGNAEAGDSAPGTPAQVEQAAQWAGADQVARKLACGYDTELTRRFEGGVELSGGEWQKVALARGFMRDAALVILDEPTAALDADAEYQLFERFRELVAGKTALLISHRFSTVRMADQIVVLEDGRVLEVGTHIELVERGGRYAELFEMQAGRYR